MVAFKCGTFNINKWCISFGIEDSCGENISNQNYYKGKNDGAYRKFVYGFEINKEFYRKAKEQMCVLPKTQQMSFADLLQA